MNQEKCPFTKCQTVSKIFGHIGGEISIVQHAVKVRVPEGAISEGHEVQIETAASLFGPFIIPEDYDPIGAYVWIAAHYEFKKSLMVQIEHDVFVGEDTDLSQLYVLTTHEKDVCDEASDKALYKMYEDTCEYNFSLNNSSCTIFTSRFCSKCPAKRRKAEIAKRVIMYHYLPEDYRSVNEFVAEVSFCYDLPSCKEVCIVYFQYIVLYMHML